MSASPALPASAGGPALPPDGDDAAWRDAAKAALAGSAAVLAARFDAGEPVGRLLGGRAGAVDAVVVSAWGRALGARAADAALFATGGYGRGELFPQSDVDLLVLAEPKLQRAIEPALQRFFALLWDAGLPTGHAVRSLAQCREAAADITVLTALSERRRLAGAEAAVAALDALMLPKAWSAQAFFAGKRDELRLRHARFNDTAFNLEPHLKDGPGSLRDLHTLAWMAQRLFGVRGLAELVPLGLLGEDECAALEREYAALSRLRMGLHLVAARREERLLFDHQKALAERLGLVDEHRDNLAVEQMMQGFFRSAAVVLRISDRLLQRFEEQLEGEAPAEPVDAEFELRRGYLVLRRPEALARDPAMAFRLFATWSALPNVRGLHSASARVLAEALGAFPAYTAADAGMRAAFMDLLRAPGAVATLARMARLGLLARWLPAFGEVSGRMQYDLFHVYTVDQHTLAVLRNIAGFAAGADPRFSVAHEVHPRLRAPELLLLAGLFHDIAKGRGGDHSELGEHDARAFCQAMGLPAGDGELVAWLVRKHLLMSITAQKQDIADPGVVTRFASEVGDRERLDYLYLLTCADIAGTSPKLWNAWKDRLLSELHVAARFALRRGLAHPVDVAERVAGTRAGALGLLEGEGLHADRVLEAWAAFPEAAFLRYRPDQLAWVTRGVLDAPRERPSVFVRPLAGPGALEVFVYAPDRDGLFAAVAATLDRLGLGVFHARVLTSRDGMSLDSFMVLAHEGRSAPADAVIIDTLEQALARAPGEVRPARRQAPRHLRHFRMPARVEFSDATGPGEGARRQTQLGLVCTDRPGLLADVAQVLRLQRLRVHDARIATFGERAEDFFLITDERDEPLDDPTLRDGLREALVACVEGPP